MLNRIPITILTVLCLTIAVAGQEKLTNDSILRLVKEGINEELIVGMIDGQPGEYSLGVEDILGLKKQSVSDKILSAMIRKEKTRTSNDSTSPNVAASYPSEVGIYYKKGTEWVELLPEIVNWKTGGVLKSVATIGVIKQDVNAHIEGRQSKNQVTVMEFLVYAPEGVAITEYQLLKLRKNSSNREFRTYTGGVFHASGGASRDIVVFDGKRIASRLFLVTLGNLASGEYGFLPPGGFATATPGATLGKIYTFSVSR